MSPLSVAGLLSTTILVRGADSMRIGTLRTAGWCTLGTLASPSCGRENNQNKRGASKRRAARDRKSGSELRAWRSTLELSGSKKTAFIDPNLMKLWLLEKNKKI